MATTIENGGEVTYSSKSEVTTQTTEIVADEQIYESLVKTSEIRIPTVFQTKSFHCSYPTVDPNVVRVTEPLPFPVKLKELIAWTDAFVDRIASQTHEEEKKTILLENEVKKLSKLFRESEKKLKNSREATRTAHEETETVRREFSQYKKDARKKLDDQIKKTIEAEKTIGTQKNRIEKLEKDLKRALADDKADDARIKLLTALLASATSERDDFEKLYLSTLAELSGVQDELNFQKSQVSILTETVKSLETQIITKDETIDTLEKKLDAVKQTLQKAQVDLQAANDAIATLTTERDNALKKVEDLNFKIKEKEEIIVSLNDQVATLTAEKKAAIEAQEKAEAARKRAEDRSNGLSEDNKSVRSQLSTKTQELTAQIERADLLNKDLQAERLEKRAAETRAQAAEENLKKEQTDQHQKAEEALKIAKINGDELRTKLAKLESLANPIRVPGRRVNIITVEYGGKAYTHDADPAVFEKLYTHADERTPFDISNAFFEDDPKEGVVKTTSITYQFTEGGAPLQIVGSEYTQAEFQ